MFLLSKLSILKKNWQILIWVILVISYFSIGIFSILNSGLAGDESAHLAAAHSYVDGEGINVEHPTLLKNLNAILIKVFFDDYKSDDSGQWSRGVDFLIFSNLSSCCTFTYYKQRAKLSAIECFYVKSWYFNSYGRISETCQSYRQVI